MYRKALLVVLACLSLTACGSDSPQTIVQTKEIPRTAVQALVDPNLFQAVFLDDGSYYFGKLKVLPSAYVLTHVYYSQKSVQDLVKLTSSPHHPKDMMVVEAARVKFWENLDPSSPMSQEMLLQKGS